MKKSFQQVPTTTRRAGFTLIEMLIVVLIICILISIGFGGYRMARDAAWKERARDSARQICTAWNLRLQYDRQFPSYTNFVGRTGTDTGANAEITFQTTIDNMAALNNGDRIWLDQSADQRSADTTINGMRDRWGRFFYVRLDMNYDGTVKNPYDSTSAIRANVAVWSLGPNPANSNSWVAVWQ